MESMINRWEIEREDTLTAKVQQLNQKVQCRLIAEREDGTQRACLARSQRAGGGILCQKTISFRYRHCWFVCSSGTGDTLDCTRSFSDHASTSRGLQNWTLCTTKHLPTRHRRRPRHRRWGCCRCCRRHRRPGRRRRRSCCRKKKVKIIALDKAFRVPSDYEQAAAAGKPAPDLGPGPAGNKRHSVLYRETE